MVNSCCVTGCKNESYPGSRLSFHGFPKNDNQKLKWENAVSGKITKSSVVCSAHFECDDFIAGSIRKMLKPDAVPSRFLKCASSLSSAKILKTESGEAPTTSSVGGALVTVIKTEVNPDSDPLQSRRCASPSGLSDIGSSDLEDALDTRGMLLLKQKLREKEEKLKEREESLRDKNEKLKLKDEKIERLEKANKHLNEKIVSLKQLIVKMKKKLLLLKRKVQDQSDDKDLDDS